MSRRVLVVAPFALWSLLGLLGLFHYVQGYDLYRGFAPPRPPRGVATGKRVTASFPSTALGQRRSVEVQLPPGYAQAAAAGRRFPVVYLLHGNPGNASQLFRIGAADVAEDTLLARGRVRPMILVVPDGRSSGFGAHTEWANARAGRWESFLLEVVRFIDAHFATLADRRHRVLAGLSEGGFAAANVALHRVHTFGGFQSWSGYFRETSTGPFQGLPARTIAANSPALYAPRLARMIRRLGLQAFLYQGTQQRHGAGEIRAFAAELRAAGAHVGVGLYGGGHDWALWRAQMPHMLELANRWFGATA